MPKKENKTSGADEIQFFELTMSNTEDQDELNRRLRKPGVPEGISPGNLGELTKEYKIEEHRHRFSVWAAARATQRNFTTVDKLRKALESSGVREFLAKGDFETLDETAFEELHREWCGKIMASLENAGVNNVTYGRATKLIGIYLKSMILLGPRMGSTLSRIAHPPIDRILLSNLAKCSKVDSTHKREWSKIRWTLLNEERYFRLIRQLREILEPDEPFWMLERYWTVTDEKGI